MAHAVGRPGRPVVVARLYQRSNRVNTRRKKTAFVTTGIHPGTGVGASGLSSVPPPAFLPSPPSS